MLFRSKILDLFRSSKKVEESHPLDFTERTAAVQSQNSVQEQAPQQTVQEISQPIIEQEIQTQTTSSGTETPSEEVTPSEPTPSPKKSRSKSSQSQKKATSAKTKKK